VTRTCNLSYKEGRDWRIAVRGQNGQKVSEIIFLRTSWVWWYIPVIPVTQKTQAGGS
jgi:hypothetical protein